MIEDIERKPERFAMTFVTLKESMKCGLRMKLMIKI